MFDDIDQINPLIIDLVGPEVSEEEREILQHPLVGGVILFSRNYESRSQVQNLIDQIQKIRLSVAGNLGRLLICVDQEGGRVQRFKKEFTLIPAFEKLGSNCDITSLESIAKSIFEVTKFGITLGRELKEVGIDLSFTPVLDLNWSRSEVIGDRSFSSDPYLVSILGKSMIHGLQISGLKNCIKHFPGHGWVKADSHFMVTTDSRSFQEIQANDLIPFKELCSIPNLVSAVMPAHVIYSECDRLPASFSKFWLIDILRNSLKFDGLIISDDLSMKGAANFSSSIVNRATQALANGCNAILVCNETKDVIKLIDDLDMAEVQKIYKSQMPERLFPIEMGK